MSMFRGRYLVASVALLTLIAIIGCSQDAATPVPEFLKIAEENTPFDIALPSFLTHDMELVAADVIVLPPGIEMQGERRQTYTQVVLRFANADESATFVLYESIAGSSLGSANVSNIDVGKMEGQMVEDEELKFLTIAWPGDGIGFLLTGYLTGTLTRDEIMRIAESVGS